MSYKKIFINTFKIHYLLFLIYIEFPIVNIINKLKFLSKPSLYISPLTQQPKYFQIFSPITSATQNFS